jgi:hypothetical protein
VGGDTGERYGPVCYTRSGVNGNVIMTVHVNLYVSGPALKGNYMVSAQLIDHATGTRFLTDVVAATVGTLTNGLTHKTDNLLTADLTAANFIIPSVIAKENYSLDFFVSSSGGLSFAKAGESQTIVYVINGGLPAAWTYNGQKDMSTTPAQNDADTHPLLSVLDIASRACSGLNLAAAAGGNYTPIIEAIWAEFVNNRAAGVMDGHGNHMIYWGPIVEASAAANLDKTTGLIANKAGDCGGWAALLVDCFRAEGINAYVYGITPIPTAYPPPNPRDTFDGFVVSSSKGQGNDSARTGFTNHAVVELVNNGSGGVYDPSYGTYFSSAQAWMDASESSFQWTKPGGGFDNSPHQAKKADSTFSIQNF